MVILIGIGIISHLLIGFSLSKFFDTAGEEGWKGYVPVYNILPLLKIVGKPTWWVILFLIPGVNIIVGMGVIIDLLKCFSKNSFWDHFLGILVPFIYLPIAVVKNDLKYIGKVEELPIVRKSIRREWADAIAFAVVAASIIRWSIMEPFTIPTPSMEGSLLVGDFLFVSKMHYGTRTPKTILQVPLTHQKIWGTDLPSYVDWVQLPQFRLPGFTSIKRNDVVVFNVPGLYENNILESGRVEPDKEKWHDYPVDLKTNYIKRCVGVPGDVLEVKNSQLYINGVEAENPVDMQYHYVVTSNDPINDRLLKKFDISESYVFGRNEEGVKTSMQISPSTASQLEALPFITNVERDIRPEEKVEHNIFPSAELFPWNADFYGPLTIPAEGMEIDINKETLATYGKTIRLYDHNDDVEIKEDQLFIDGQQITKYTFNQNYYFLMGDNRHNSLDSRYWGFVPEDHVVGKGSFIWLSLDKNESGFSKIRWSRLFKGIE